MKKIFKTFCQKVSATLYPPICLHCEDEMKDNRFLFCPRCIELLALADNPKEKKYGWLFEKLGPAVTLFASFSKGRQIVFSKTIASYVVLQMERLAWPLPDHIFTLSKSSAMKDLLRELSSLLKRPQKCFWQKEGTFLFLAEEMDAILMEGMQKKMPNATIYGMGIFPSKESRLSK